MANRSDFNSKLPRKLKKLLALSQFKNVHEENEVRRLFLGAHAHHKQARYNRQKAREVSHSADSE